jgi:ribose transport system permease protein
VAENERCQTGWRHITAFIFENGEGTVFGSILGIALVATVTGSMILLDVSVYWQELIRGCIVLAAVSLDHLRHHKR